MYCEGLKVCARGAQGIAPLEQAPAGPTWSLTIYAVSVMAVPMTLSGLSASVRAVIDEPIIAKTNPSSIRGLSESLKERKSDWQGAGRARIISGMERTEGLELTAGAAQINGPEETEEKEDNSFLVQALHKGFSRVFLVKVFGAHRLARKQSLLNIPIHHIIVSL